MKLRIFDLQRASTHDGPGLRTTVFLQGCPLRCAWCHNPESQAAGPVALFDAAACLGCGRCRDTGDTAAARGATCPTGARHLVGEEVGLDELVAAAARDADFCPGGGVTLGGGEPLAQWPAVAVLADALRARGLHCALDTSGHAPAAVIAAVPDRFDLVVVDLKLIDPAAHRRWTGVDNAQILAAIRTWSAALPGRLWVTLPLVPGVHDVAALRAAIAFLAHLPGPPPLRLAPYHRFGEHKYAQLDRPVPAFPGDAALAARAADLAAAAGLRVLPDPCGSPA